MNDSTKKHPLQSLNIVVTRPRHQSKPLCEKIIALGGHPLIIPSMQIKALDPTPSLAQLSKKLTTTDFLIFTSANAVEHALKLLKELNQEQSPHFIATGPGTQKALQRVGINQVILPNTYSSEGILALPILESVKDKKIYLCTGKDPRPLLSESLRKRGANVIPILCYERLPNTLSKQDTNHLKEKPSHCVITTSFAGLQFWHQMIIQANLTALLTTPTVIVHPRYKAPAEDLGFLNLIVSKSADDDSVIHAIVQHFDEYA